MFIHPDKVMETELIQGSACKTWLILLANKPCCKKVKLKATVYDDDCDPCCKKHGFFSNEEKNLDEWKY